MAYSSELPSEDPLDPASRNLGPNVLGREEVYRDSSDVDEKQIVDDEYNRIEMVRRIHNIYFILRCQSSADAERKPHTWGKPLATIKDLDVSSAMNWFTLNSHSSQYDDNEV